MGYTLTIAAVRRVQPLLEELTKAAEKNEARQWKTDESGKLAYRLREALVAAAVCASKDADCKRFADLHSQYVVRAGIGVVVAEPRLKTLSSKVQKSLSQIRLPEVEDLSGAVGAAITHDADEIHFPSVKLADVDSDTKNNFFKWTTSGATHWYVVDNFDDGFTLIRVDPGEELRWQPKI